VRMLLIAPPHAAVQVPLAALAASQNSHSLTLPLGWTCSTEKFLSPHVAGAALPGIGTALQAWISAGSS
jgi:hypothetical protein